ncbi:DUF4376 domain-containing protein [Campylobacter insulaenigrae]|uniref:DUF4376 domain-containing protein n=1 Tax=Campylobacter insulaenigrae TaxID=260714 RepID=UPI0021530A2C|nr:DUF4376 domain-containing protein [Campylobacter insulaenigrae]MCR6593629.1 DUF4376 domain-containing protein [Campylobacter insulaenigrae]
MKYFIDNNNQIYAYEDDVKNEQIKEGLIPLSEEEFNTLINPPKSEDAILKELKENKINEIRIKKNEVLEGGIVYNNKIFQTREKDKLNINGAVTNLMLDMQSGSGSIKEIVWIDIEDKKVIFTPQEFLQFAAAVAYNTQEITFKANALKEKVEQANSKEELEIIVWEE